MDNTKINTWELVSLTSVITFTPLLVTLPRSAAEAFGTGALLHAIYIGIVVTIYFLAIFKLYKNIENKDIFDLSQIVGGNLLKILTGIVLIAYLLTTSFITINEFSEDVKNVLFPDNSVQSVSIIFILGVAIAAYFGIKGALRISSVLFPVLIIGLIAIFFSLLEDIDLLNLFPLIGTGRKEIFLNGLNHAGRYNSLFLIFILAPKISNLKKSGMYSILSTSAVILFVVFLIFSVIPYPEISENYFAFFEITRMISFGRFFQRVEVIFTFIWLFVSLVYLTIATAVIVYTFKKAFKIEYPNLLLPLITLSFIGLVYIFPDTSSLLITRDFMYSYVTPIIVFIYPLVLLIIAKFKYNLNQKGLMLQNEKT
ncbi:MAG: GerAB/ArcD/ProY family transporter [Clostridia bacterium]|nr:GerAB/ArcD/ProY family transporter [Clostridia bacterium]